MNVHISYKGLDKTPEIDSTVQQQLNKLQRRVQLFRPELVSLHGSVLQKSSRAGYLVALNLKLPSTDLATEQASPSAVTAIKAAFEALTDQVTRHREILSNRHNFPRRRHATGRKVINEVPFEDTVAVVRPPSISNEDVTGYINANLPRLRRFIARELRFREDNDQLQRGSIGIDEVVDEAIGAALGDTSERPGRMALEPWLHRLSVEAINRLANGDGAPGNVPLERPERPREGDGGDESTLQFHQPDADLSSRSLDVNEQIATPEDLAAKDEMIELVERTLRDAGRNEREAFILFTIEGFTVEEIADITQRSQEEVRNSVHVAREHLKRALPARDPLSDRLIEQAKSA